VDELSQLWTETREFFEKDVSTLDS
jgi:hypothetical protein